MRLSVRFIELTARERAFGEMERIGVDPAGIRIMLDKQFHYNLKVENLTPAQANVIKQEILSAGGEAAVARGSASCSVSHTDAILSGTLKHYKILIDKLSVQSFGLIDAARPLQLALENIQRRSFAVEGRSGAVWALGPKTLLMGILNVTPDSFYDGGRFVEKERAVERGLEMVEEGAAWIDVGGESTRPGSLPVPLSEELRRVMPVVSGLVEKGVVVSIDTRKARVAKEALKAGAELINDVSALTHDKEMAGVCAEFNAPVMLMHMRGTPETMQADTGYRDIIGEVFNFLAGRVEFALEAGIKPEKTIIDPGIGFGKSAEGSIELIKRLGEFKTLGRPVLAGVSRKSFIGKTLGNTDARSEGRLYGTLAALTAAIMNGAHILRVHDVKEAREAAVMADALKDLGA